jgi:hypothetical protein
MLGTFQHSNLRIEVKATDVVLRHCLLETDRLRQWLWPARFSPALPETLYSGLTFTSWLGLIPVQHQVEAVEPNRLLFILSQGIDGFHEWHWGDGWVQSNLEGISLLPLNLGQTANLLRLRWFLSQFTR